LLSEDSYLLKGLQSADKTKMHPRAKLQNTPTFTGNGSHSRACLIKIKSYTYQLCKQQSADTNVLIRRYRLLANYWPSLVEESMAAYCLVYDQSSAGGPTV